MLKPLRKIYLLFAGCALLIAFLVALLASQKILPYQLILSKQKTLDALGRFYFYDLDHDGYQERIEMIKEPLDQYYYIKVYRDYDQGLIDQFNFKKEIVFRSPTFFDLNKDGCDDLFVFSNNDDSLYLSVIDVKNVRFLQKEKSVLASSPNRSGEKWDIHSIVTKFVQLTPDSPVQMLFALTSGYARLPRCLCLYDLRQQKIIRRFNFNMGSVRFTVTDLNRDGFKEIALGSSATNNFPPEVPLSDAYSWFVLLDHQFNYLKPPLKLGEKFSGVETRSIQADGKNYLLIWKNKPFSRFMLMDSGFNIIAGNQFKTFVKSFLIDTGAISPQIIAGLSDGVVEVFDHHLNLIKRKTIPNIRPPFILKKCQNILGDAKNEALCYDRESFYLFNHKWQVLAKFSLPKQLNIHDIYVVFKPDANLPDIVLTAKNRFTELRLISANLYSKIPLAFLASLLLSFFILITGYWSIEKIRQYVFAFFFLLHQSDNAIILLDYKGRIISVNKKVNRFLKLDQSIRKGQTFESALKQRPQIVNFIRTSMEQTRQVNEQFSFEDALNTFIGTTTITPFFSLFRFVFAYLIEIKDSTEQVLLERQRNWQRNVRKMVHDIKTPIAGVQLKLQMLYQKLAEDHCKGQDTICRELEDAHSELKRIRNIAQDFLKFSDLERLNIVEIKLKDLMTHALAPFEFFKTKLLHINLKMDSNLPELVYWDERQIELLLHVLIENAIDALQGKGEINIEVKEAEPQTGKTTNWVEFHIQDNGPGIPEEFRDKIFEPHFSTKQEGSGMGLSFAKHIVQQHNGRLEIISETQRGALFIVRLPVRVNNEH